MQKNLSDKELKEMEAPLMGMALNGFGVNLLVSSIQRTMIFLQNVFALSALRQDDSFSVLRYEGHIIFFHSDVTYSENELLSLIPESGLRGAGIELRLYNCDPDLAEKRALDKKYTVLRTTSNRPHGLRECYILDPDGYCWVPSIPII